MLYRIGFILLMLGMATADSDNLVIPTVLVGIGMVLILIGQRKEADHEDTL